MGRAISLNIWFTDWTFFWAGVGVVPAMHVVYGPPNQPYMYYIATVVWAATALLCFLALLIIVRLRERELRKLLAELAELEALQRGAPPGSLLLEQQHPRGA